MSFWDVPGMKAGVVTGDVAWALYTHAKENGYAIPAFNCTSTSTVNAVLEAGKKLNRPVTIQFSEGGSAFFAGKSLPNDKGKLQASILGAVCGAHYVRQVAPAYGIPVIVHSDHCAKKLLPWFDGMLEADEAFFKSHGESLFTSHMLDLSEELGAGSAGSASVASCHRVGVCGRHAERGTSGMLCVSFGTVYGAWPPAPFSGARGRAGVADASAAVVEPAPRRLTPTPGSEACAHRRRRRKGAEGPPG